MWNTKIRPSISFGTFLIGAIEALSSKTSRWRLISSSRSFINSLRTVARRESFLSMWSRVACFSGIGVIIGLIWLSLWWRMCYISVWLSWHVSNAPVHFFHHKRRLFWHFKYAWNNGGARLDSQRVLAQGWHYSYVCYMYKGKSIKPLWQSPLKLATVL